MKNYWNNASKSYPHTIKMMERADVMFDEALRMADCNELTGKEVYPWSEVNDMTAIACDLKLFALRPVEFAEEPTCPFGLALTCHEADCYCRTAARVRAMEPDDGCTCIDGSCPACQKRAGEVFNEMEMV